MRARPALNKPRRALIKASRGNCSRADATMATNASSIVGAGRPPPARSAADLGRRALRQHAAGVEDHDAIAVLASSIKCVVTITVTPDGERRSAARTPPRDGTARWSVRREQDSGSWRPRSRSRAGACASGRWPAGTRAAASRTAPVPNRRDGASPRRAGRRLHRRTRGFRPSTGRTARTSRHVPDPAGGSRAPQIDPGDVSTPDAGRSPHRMRWRGLPAPFTSSRPKISPCATPKRMRSTAMKSPAARDRGPRRPTPLRAPPGDGRASAPRGHDEPLGSAAGEP